MECRTHHTDHLIPDFDGQVLPQIRLPKSREAKTMLPPLQEQPLYFPLQIRPASQLCRSHCLSFSSPLSEPQNTDMFRLLYRTDRKIFHLSLYSMHK